MSLWSEPQRVKNNSRFKMIMSYAAHRRDFSPFLGKATGKTEHDPKRAGILRRLLDVFIQFQQRDVDRQIARFLAAHSARSLTDELEREISQRLSTSNWRMNASRCVERRFP
jgi:hypothetical protein